MSVFRWLLLILIIGAGAIALYGLLVETSSLRLPMVVSSLAVAGIAAGILGFLLAGSAIRLGERGRGLPATGVAILGGLFVMGAAGALAVAIMLGILTGGF